MDTVATDTKVINCPEHPGQSHARLYTWPHKWAGIWECPVSGTSDSHEHEDLKVEEAVENYYDPGNEFGHGQREYKIYVCSGCGVQVEGDPELDAAEAREGL